MGNKGWSKKEHKWVNMGPNSDRAHAWEKANERRAIADWMKTDGGKKWKQDKKDRGGWKEWKNFSESDGGGLCFITTAVCKTLNKPDACEELTKFRYFRDSFMQGTPKMKAEVEEYYEIAPKICARIESKGEEYAAEKYTSIWEKCLRPAFLALEEDEKQKAYDIYKDMVMSLKSEFMKD